MALLKFLDPFLDYNRNTFETGFLATFLLILLLGKLYYNINYIISYKGGTKGAWFGRPIVIGGVALTIKARAFRIRGVALFRQRQTWPTSRTG